MVKLKMTICEQYSSPVSQSDLFYMSEKRYSFLWGQWAKSSHDEQ